MTSLKKEKKRRKNKPPSQVIYHCREQRTLSLSHCKAIPSGNLRFPAGLCNYVNKGWGLGMTRGPPHTHTHTHTLCIIDGSKPGETVTTLHLCTGLGDETLVCLYLSQQDQLVCHFQGFTSLFTYVRTWYCVWMSFFNTGQLDHLREF